MAEKSIGLIETFGLAACVTAADAAAKSANVRLLGYEYAKGGGMCTVKVEGEVAACRAAIAAANKAVERMGGTTGGTKSTLIIGRPADSTSDVFIYNRETVGGDIALAEGYRPKGESRMPVLVKHWKPKAESPMEEAPEPPVVEELAEESLEEESEQTEKLLEVTESLEDSESEEAETVTDSESEDTEAEEDSETDSTEE